MNDGRRRRPRHFGVQDDMAAGDIHGAKSVSVSMSRVSVTGFDDEPVGDHDMDLKSNGAAAVAAMARIAADIIIRTSRAARLAGTRPRHLLGHEFVVGVRPPGPRRLMPRERPATGRVGDNRPTLCPALA